MRFSFSFCDPCRIQTCNPHIRSVVLYSVELMDPEVSPFSGETGLRRKGHYPFLCFSYPKSGCKSTAFFSFHQIKMHFFCKKTQKTDNLPTNYLHSSFFCTTFAPAFRKFQTSRAPESFKQVGFRKCITSRALLKVSNK